MTIGERIKELRLKNKLTQEEVAKKIGVATQTIYKYENEIVTNIPSDKIENIANVFNVSPAYLMGWEDDNVDEEDKELLLMFGKKLKEIRKSKNITLEMLAEEYNKCYNGSLSKGTLSKYENGKQQPMISVVDNLAELLCVLVDELLGKENAYNKSENDEKTQEIINQAIKPIKTKKFPMLGKIACGKPIYADEDYETYIEASENIKADFCLTAMGDSMINARIFNGDVVFIRSQPLVENGEIAAVIIENEVTLKRFYKYENSIELRAENPTFQPMYFRNEELNSIRILGKAVAFQSYL